MIFRGKMNPWEQHPTRFISCTPAAKGCMVARPAMKYRMMNDRRDNRHSIATFNFDRFLRSRGYLIRAPMSKKSRARAQAKTSQGNEGHSSLFQSKRSTVYNILRYSYWSLAILPERLRRTCWAPVYHPSLARTSSSITAIQAASVCWHFSSR